MFDELVNETSKDILSHEQRKRLRTSEEQHRFEYAVRYILSDLWKASKCIPTRSCLINLRSGSYSENPQYRDPNLTYRQVKSVFDTMISMRLIEITIDGYYDRVRMESSLTCYTARDELQERLLHLEGHPAIILKPDLDSETILLRNTFDGRRQLQEYDNTIKINSYRDNLKSINKCFIKHWPDLRIMDTEVSTLSNRIEKNSNKEPIDFSSRTLVRIFSSGSFKKGGRFYRGWWQNIPSDYRKFITLDSKKTTEYDFSQLNPHMIYHRYGYELGSEDAYDRVFNGLHRDTVKEAFNAMIQSSTPLRNCPTNINIDHLGISWTDLKERILAAHKPITDLFFKGLGNQLQFEDSCVAESVMLQFAKIDAPALPIHDSFIMHHDYGGELEEAMRRAYYERFNEDIKVKEEIINEIKAPDIEKQPDLSSDNLINGEVEYSQWQERDRMWWANK